MCAKKKKRKRNLAGLGNNVNIEMTTTVWNENNNNNNNKTHIKSVYAIRQFIYKKNKTQNNMKRMELGNTYIYIYLARNNSNNNNNRKDIQNIKNEPERDKPKYPGEKYYNIFGTTSTTTTMTCVGLGGIVNARQIGR